MPCKSNTQFILFAETVVLQELVYFCHYFHAKALERAVSRIYDFDPWRKEFVKATEGSADFSLHLLSNTGTVLPVLMICMFVRLFHLC